MSNGIKGHASTEVVTGRKLFTGIAPVKVISINPTMEELKALGLNPIKEPEYITSEFVEEKRDEQGNVVTPASNYTKNRLDFNVFNPQYKFYNKVTIWLEDRLRYSRDRSKVQWINKFGQTAWTSDLETPASSAYNWFKKDMERPALVGEEKLTLFIRSWANCDADQQAVLEDPVKLVKGDYTEIKSLHKAIINNEVVILNGIRKVEKDGKVSYYQSAYDGYFGRPYLIKDFIPWKKALTSEYTKFADDFQDDLNFREYTGDSTVVSDKPSNLDLPQGATVSNASPYNF